MKTSSDISGKRQRLLMDQGWRFHLGEIPFPEAKAHGEAYNCGWAKTGVFSSLRYFHFYGI